MALSLTPSRPKSRRTDRCAIVALSDAHLAKMIERVLRRLGCAPLRATSAAEVRAHLDDVPGSIVILGPELADESGWLCCAKLSHPVPRAKVLMIGAKTPRHQMMARLTGAAALLSDPVEVAEWV
jgi:DNA-binding response OmpR family regulator